MFNYNPDYVPVITSGDSDVALGIAGVLKALSIALDKNPSDNKNKKTEKPKVRFF